MTPVVNSKSIAIASSEAQAHSSFTLGQELRYLQAAHQQLQWDFLKMQEEHVQLQLLISEMNQRLRVYANGVRKNPPTYAQDIAPGGSPFREREAEFKRNSPYAQ